MLSILSYCYYAVSAESAIYLFLVTMLCLEGVLSIISYYYYAVSAESAIHY